MLISARKIISLVWYWNPFPFSKKVFFFIKDLLKNILCASMCLCGCAHSQQHVGAWWDQKMALDLLELQLKVVVVSCLMLVLGTELRPFGRISSKYQGLFTTEPSHQHQEDVLWQKSYIQLLVFLSTSCVSWAELSNLLELEQIKPLKSEGKSIHLKRMFWKTKHEELWSQNLGLSYGKSWKENVFV